MANPEDYSRIWMLREEDRITGESFEDTSTVFAGLEANYYDSIELQGYLVAEDMNVNGYTDSTVTTVTELVDGETVVTEHNTQEVY